MIRRVGSTHWEACKIVGVPDMDAGSRIHSFVYRLEDGSSVTMGFGNLDVSYFYIRHERPDGTSKDLPLK